ncbi:glucose-6-phosphate isomerase [archaeon BMS3Abin17]|nr:glucose-6-phosphate isomerase [archaeon BMS3Abin17]HDZ60950.1 cupin domain-containing protein [Candidatus Pacearchaeota archaeon]
MKKEYEKKTVRKLNDMKDRFKNTKGVRGNPLLYTVYINDFRTYETGLTVIEPGTINKEFYMTKGHRHKKPSREIYIPLSGKGKLLLQGAKAKLISMKKGEVYIIPKNQGHRLINTGNKRFEILTIYSKDTGHDYNFKFKKRVFK